MKKYFDIIPPPTRSLGPSCGTSTPASETLADRQPAAADSCGCCGQHRPPQQPCRGAFDAPARRAHANAKIWGRLAASFLAAGAGALRPNTAGRRATSPRSAKRTASGRRREKRPAFDLGRGRTPLDGRYHDARGTLHHYHVPLPLSLVSTPHLTPPPFLASALSRSGGGGSTCSAGVSQAEGGGDLMWQLRQCGAQRCESHGRMLATTLNSVDLRRCMRVSWTSAGSTCCLDYKQCSLPASAPLCYHISSTSAPGGPHFPLPTLIHLFYLFSLGSGS